MPVKNLKQSKPPFWKNFNATRFIVIIIGVGLALTGMVHGIWEISYGNMPTGGLVLTTVGAFTLIPNYLATGITAVIIGILIIIWTIGFIQTKNGPAVFILLFILLFLSGGGFAQVLVFIITWAISTRINKPLLWWQKVLPEKTRQSLDKKWLFFFIACMLMFAVGVQIWLTRFVPGVSDPNLINYVCWSFLIVGLIFLILTIISGFAHDIERQKK